MGHQVIGLAAGARTVKLPYGNRGHNIPALDLTTGAAIITSQNHGYALDASSLPSEFKPYFINLNDGSNEGMDPLFLTHYFINSNWSTGLMHKDRPIFSLQVRGRLSHNEGWIRADTPQVSSRS
jgi:carbamoyl-phosphate synthase small subunit